MISGTLPLYSPGEELTGVVKVGWRKVILQTFSTESRMMETW